MRLRRVDRSATKIRSIGITLYARHQFRLPRLIYADFRTLETKEYRLR